MYRIYIHVYVCRYICCSYIHSEEFVLASYTTYTVCLSVHIWQHVCIFWFIFPFSFLFFPFSQVRPHVQSPSTALVCHVPKVNTCYLVKPRCCRPSQAKFKIGPSPPPPPHPPTHPPSPPAPRQHLGNITTRISIDTTLHHTVITAGHHPYAAATSSPARTDIHKVVLFTDRSGRGGMFVVRVRGISLSYRIFDLRCCV